MHLLDERYPWPEYRGEIPISFVNCQQQVERLRKALGLLDERLLQFLFRRGVNFSLCAEHHTPRHTLPRWYPFESDAWARRYFGTTYDEAWGWYEADTRTVIATKQPVVATVLHEVGHAVDYLLHDISTRYFRPGRGVTPYAETDGREFWAEAFEMWFSPWGDRARVQQAHPDFPQLFSTLPIHTLPIHHLG